MSKNFFSKIFYRRPPKAVIEASRARWVLRLRRVYSGLLCTPSNLMYTQQAHVIFRPPRTLVRLATPASQRAAPQYTLASETSP